MTDNNHGFDAVDLYMIKRGDMLGSKLGERVFEALTAPGVVDGAQAEAEMAEMENTTPSRDGWFMAVSGTNTPTPEIDGLIGRLRKGTVLAELDTPGFVEHDTEATDDLMADAADNIAKLLAHISALEARFDLELDAYAKDSDMAALRARAEKAEERLVRAREVLEPLDEIADEGNEDQPDETQCIIHAGRSIVYTTKLADFRAIRAFLREISNDE